ncbi:MAG: diaminopimelate decarboxylase [Synergistaceae bacterium]|nr:diaminopimelate decarboxylase [Synergistaceae bacterium]
MSNLTWGGCDVIELARKFGTPLYVLSEDIIRARCREVKEKFLDKWENTDAYYAGKAFLTMAMARIIESEGFGLDLVSCGEIYTAYKSGFSMERTLLHGSAKSDEEITEALLRGVGRIVIDNIPEISQVVDIAGKLGIRAPILIRVATGVDPDTHVAMRTSHTGGKFGISLIGDNLEQAVKLAVSHPQLDLYGFHFHVGSMISEPNSHIKSAEVMINNIKQLRDSIAFETRELDIGGGLGTAPSPDVKTLEIAYFTDPIMTKITEDCERFGLPMPKVMIEPGRWIVSEAGITLYSVESVKETGHSPEDRVWINVDGGMYDNPRPCLYGAKYNAVIANKVDAEGSREFAIAGHCCESGDTLIEAIKLPEPERGDVVVFYNTGAYTFSMANNYNRMRRPAVILVRDGKAEIIVKRQSYEDLLEGDVIPEHLSKV